MDSYSLGITRIPKALALYQLIKSGTVISNGGSNSFSSLSVSYFTVFLKSNFPSHLPPVFRYDFLYEQHFNNLTLQGKRPATIDGYSRSIRTYYREYGIMVLHDNTSGCEYVFILARRMR